jgi:hypothetical protein
MSHDGNARPGELSRPVKGSPRIVEMAGKLQDEERIQKNILNILHRF